MSCNSVITSNPILNVKRSSFSASFCDVIFLILEQCLKPHAAGWMRQFPLRFQTHNILTAGDSKSGMISVRSVHAVAAFASMKGEFFPWCNSGLWSIKRMVLIEAGLNSHQERTVQELMWRADRDNLRKRVSVQPFGLLCGSLERIHTKSYEPMRKQTLLFKLDQKWQDSLQCCEVKVSSDIC